MAYGKKAEKSKLGPKEAAMREMREQRVESHAKVRAPKVVKVKRSGRGR